MPPTPVPPTLTDPSAADRDHDRIPGLTRRCVLLGLGGAGAAAALAACSAGSGGGGATSAATTAAPSSSAATAALTPAGSGSAAASPPTAGAAGIAALADVPVGGTGSGTSGSDTVLLSQKTAGTVEGFSPVCPHQGGQVKPNGDKFRCSLHFSEFDLDGHVTKGPAQRDLTPVAVTVSGDQIVKG